MNKAVSDYMRAMQRRSAAARRAALSDYENKQRMTALAKARWAKAKRKPKRAPLANKRAPSASYFNLLDGRG